MGSHRWLLIPVNTEHDLHHDDNYCLGKSFFLELARVPETGVPWVYVFVKGASDWWQMHMVVPWLESQKTINVGLCNVHSDTQVSFHEVGKCRRERLPRM